MPASSPELEDPLPPKMPRFRVALTLSPSAPEIVPFWGSGGGRFRPRGSGQRFFELEEARLAGLARKSHQASRWWTLQVG